MRPRQRPNWSQVFKQKSDSASPVPAPTDAVQQARTRARQRLIGATVLLAIGIIGFPLVFETQPRPIPVDIPIEIPKRDALPPLAAPPLGSASGPTVAATSASRPRVAQTMPRADAEVITESRSEVAAPRPTASAPARAAAAASPPTRAASSTTAPAARVAASTPAASEPRRVAAASAPAARPAAETSGDGDRARALLEGRPVAAASAEASPRFVVQVGAFADAEAARETRQKAEKLGLKTYTQVAQTSAGSRIRVRIGPFSSRADADAALAKVSAAGLTAVVLTL